MTIFIGIDPGMQGAIVALRDDGTLASATMQPLAGGEPSLGEMVELLKCEEVRAPIRAVAIELVHAGSAMDKRGAVSVCSTAALWRGIAAARMIPVLRPSPQTWQGVMLRDRKIQTTRKARKTKSGEMSMKLVKDTKKMAVAAAVELWPELAEMLKPTKKGNVSTKNGIADAALIAEWCRRTILLGGTK